MRPIFRRIFSPAALPFAEFSSHVARLLVLPLLATTAQADTWYWDSNGAVAGTLQGSGTWSTSTDTWLSGSTNVNWNNAGGHTAHFGTSAGAGPSASATRTVTVSGTVNASGLVFNTSTSGFGYILTGGEIALANGSTIEVVRGTSTDTNRRHEIHSTLSGDNISIIRSATADAANLAMLRLYGSNTWTGKLTLSSASTNGLFVEAMTGASLNNLGNITVGQNVSLVLATSDEFTKAFSINGTGAGGRGAIRFDVDGGKISGGLTLEGDASIASTGTAITGTISGGIGESGGSRALTISSGSIVLSGPNTYTGTTTVGGSAILTLAGGSTAGNVVTVNNGGTLNIAGNHTIGTTAANVTINSTGNRGTLSLVDGTVNTLTLTGGSLTVGGTGSNFSNLNFDLGNPGVSDKIITDTFTVNAGGAILNFSQITGTEIGAGTYSLVGFSTLTGAAGLQIGAVPNSPAGKVASLTLSNTSTELQLNVALANVSSNGKAYWTGSESSQWNTINAGKTNFVENADGTGATNILPDASTDVYFTASSNANPTSTLNQNFSVRSLNFTADATTAQTIGGRNLLTIGSGGLTVDAASGSHTVSSQVGIGANQAWTLAGISTQSLTVSGAVSGSGNLALNVNGARTLTISGGVNHTGTITSSGSGVGTTTISGVIGTNVTRVIQESVTSQLRLSGANTFTGGIWIKAGSVFGNSNAAAFGVGTITIGDAATNLDATLVSNLANTNVVANAIVLTSGVTAKLTITSPNTGSQNTFSGGVTGANNLLLSTTGPAAGGMRFMTAAVNNTGTVTSVGTGLGTTTIDILGTNVTSVSQAGASPFVIVSSLALSSTNRTLISTGTGLFSFTGGVTGAQNLVLQANSTGGITLSNTSGGSVNNTGSITNSGSGAGAATISAVIGNNVTGVVQNSATSAMTLSGTEANTYTGTTTVSAGVLTLSKTDVNAIAGNVLTNGGFLRFGADNQIADTAAVTVTAGGFNTSTAGVVNGGRALIETVGSLTVSGTGVFNLNGAANFTVTGAASFTGGNGAIAFLASAVSFSAGSLTVEDMSRTTGTGSASNAASENGFILYGNGATQSVVKVGAGGLTLAGTNSTNNIVLRGGSNGSKLSLDGDVTTTGTHASAIIRDSSTVGTDGTIVELSAAGGGPVVRTFNIGGGGANLTIGANISVTNGLSSSASLNKTGAGTLTLNGVNTYTGATTVNGGRLQVGAGGINSSTQISVTSATLELMAGNVINNSANLDLNNAMLIARGPSETLGTLTITGNNQIDLVAAGNAVFFANSSTSIWSSTLTILNWSGQSTGGVNGVDNRVVFGTDAQGLTASQIEKISFIDPKINGVSQTGTYGAMILSTGEVVAVIPESSSALLVILSSAAALGRRRRKCVA